LFIAFLLILFLRRSVEKQPATRSPALPAGTQF
jgi:hypothetical protein